MCFLHPRICLLWPLLHSIPVFRYIQYYLGGLQLQVTENSAQTGFHSKGIYWLKILEIQQ